MKKAISLLIAVNLVVPVNGFAKQPSQDDFAAKMRDYSQSTYDGIKYLVENYDETHLMALLIFERSLLRAIVKAEEVAKFSGKQNTDLTLPLTGSLLLSAGYLTYRATLSPSQRESLLIKMRNMSHLEEKAADLASNMAEKNEILERDKRLIKDLTNDPKNANYWRNLKLKVMQEYTVEDELKALLPFDDIRFTNYNLSTNEGQKRLAADLKSSMENSVAELDSLPKKIEDAYKKGNNVTHNVDYIERVRFSEGPNRLDNILDYNIAAIKRVQATIEELERVTEAIGARGTSGGRKALTELKLYRPDYAALYAKSRALMKILTSVENLKKKLNFAETKDLFSEKGMTQYIAKLTAFDARINASLPDNLILLRKTISIQAKDIRLLQSEHRSVLSQIKKITFRNKASKLVTGIQESKITRTAGFGLNVTLNVGMALVGGISGYLLISDLSAEGEDLTLAEIKNRLQKDVRALETAMKD